LFKIAKYFENNKKINFSVSCPADSWSKWSSYYLSVTDGKMPLNISLSHRKPDELENLYLESDLFFIPINDEYTKIASLMKLYEDIGYGVPILVAVNGESETRKFVERENVGWVVDYSFDKITEFLNYISSNPKELEEKRKNVMNVRIRHIWEERARLVAQILTSGVK